MNTVEYVTLILSMLGILGTLLKILKGFHKVINYIESVQKLVDVIVPAMAEKIDNIDKKVEVHDTEIKDIFNVLGMEKREG